MIPTFYPNLLFCASIHLPTLCTHSWICGDTFHFCLEQGNCFNDNNYAIVGSLGMPMITTFSTWPSVLCPFMYPLFAHIYQIFHFRQFFLQWFSVFSKVIVQYLFRILSLDFHPTYVHSFFEMFFYLSYSSLYPLSMMLNIFPPVFVSPLLWKKWNMNIFCQVGPLKQT